jgi:hypothetical protein
VAVVVEEGSEKLRHAFGRMLQIGVHYQQNLRTGLKEAQ